MVWFNPVMGRDGWVFWLAATSLIFPLIMLYILAVSALDPGWSSTVRLLVVLGIGFVFYHLLLALFTLYEGSLTAKKIELNQSNIKLVTFSGKVVTIPLNGPWHLNTTFLNKPYHRILFQKDHEHLVIANANRSFYISAYTDDFDELTEQLTDYFNRSHQPT